MDGKGCHLRTPIGFKQHRLEGPGSFFFLGLFLKFNTKKLTDNTLVLEGFVGLNLLHTNFKKLKDSLNTLPPHELDVGF